jgi:hypothetical protein
MVAQALTRRADRPTNHQVRVVQIIIGAAVQPPLPDPEPVARQPNCPKGHSFRAESRTGRSGNLARCYWLGGKQGRTHGAMDRLLNRLARRYG